MRGQRFFDGPEEGNRAEIDDGGEGENSGDTSERSGNSINSNSDDLWECISDIQYQNLK